MHYAKCQQVQNLFPCSSHYQCNAAAMHPNSIWRACILTFPPPWSHVCCWHEREAVQLWLPPAICQRSGVKRHAVIHICNINTLTNTRYNGLTVKKVTPHIYKPTTLRRGASAEGCNLQQHPKKLGLSLRPSPFDPGLPVQQSPVLATI